VFVNYPNCAMRSTYVMFRHYWPCNPDICFIRIQKCKEVDILNERIGNLIVTRCDKEAQLPATAVPLF